MGIKYIDFDNIKDKVEMDFNFKAHRSGRDAFHINDCAFNRRHETLATAGGDGAYYIWEYKKRKQLKTGKGTQDPITACAISADASVFAFAFGYDWATGCHRSGENPTSIYLTPLTESDVKSYYS